ncbi:MAG TPA: prolyl oligopeptidase family serine peptidase [Gemmatimonadales bacterium]|nr:prolyl oligopeptidase family serine peptidase [Gemmatimonadales bacterium]
MTRSYLLFVAGLAPACGSPAAPAVRAASEEVFHFSSAGVQLSGWLFLPEGRGPFPGVVLVHGSGPVRALEHMPLVQVFRDHGYAVLSYDKRGAGSSGGVYRGVSAANSDSMIRVLAGDAAAGLEALARDARIDRRRLGLAGGSQAGWVIPNTATRYPVAFAVILSGPLVTVGEEIHYSNLFEEAARPLEAVDSMLAAYTGPRGYDPVPDVRRMSGAVYWVWGALDRSIPAVRSAAIARDLIGEPGRSAWRMITYPTGDHALRDTGTGAFISFWEPVFHWLADVAH